MKTIKLVFFALISFLLTSSSISQTVTQEWVARYTENNSYNVPHDIIVDANGNVYVTGYSYIMEIGGNYYEYATIKYNSNGMVQWIAKYNGTHLYYDDIARCLTVDAMGNVYVTGWSQESTSNRSWATIKYNSNGVEQWVAKYNGPGNSDDFPTDIDIDMNGNIYVTGASFGNGSGYDYATIKYNSSGIVQWIARYNGFGNGADIANQISVDANGNTFVTGKSYGIGTEDDYLTIKYNSSGTEEWTARYNGGGVDYARCIDIDSEGNLYVTGTSVDFGTGSDYVTIKYSSSGIELWVKRYNGPINGIDEPYGIAIDKTGSVYVTGYSYGIGTVGDYLTIKYNSSGTEEWTARYNGTGNSSDIAIGISINVNKNIYVTGFSIGKETSFDYATIKYSSDGIQQWVERYNGPGNYVDATSGIAIDENNNIYITGESEGNGNRDYATIKYSQTTGIQNISSEIPDKFSLSQNYPNPFNPSTKIKFAVQKQGLVTIKVFDILGKEIKTLVNESLQPGTYETDFDASSLTGGVYFYKLSASDFFETKKMILAK